jgi:hypothetical protein
MFEMQRQNLYGWINRTVQDELAYSQERSAFVEAFFASARRRLRSLDRKERCNKRHRNERRKKKRRSERRREKTQRLRRRG